MRPEGRPTRDMHVSNHADNPNHPSHDTYLIAGHAAGDLVDSERSRAQELITDCTSCADLHRDLVAIASATRALPNLATAPRDFRLAPEQAARLRRRSWLRAALAPFGAARSATRPLAAAFTSLGIAGLLVGSAIPGLIGGPASSPAERDSTLGAAAAPSDAAVVPQAGGPGPSVAIPDRVNTPVSASAVPVFGASNGGPKSTDSTAEIAGADQSTPPEENAYDQSSDLRTIAQPPSMVLVGSLGLLGVGLALFGLRFAARRLR
jgi:hypothetical protein